MPKIDTLEIQRKIQELGEKLGFISCIEESFHEKNSYVPKYDVVWYLDLEKHFNLENIKEFFKEDTEKFEQMKKMRFAGFEIENSTPDPKYQIGNFMNLYAGNFIYNFIIVNNNAHKEADMYKRGIKIKHYFTENLGDKNTIFLDRIQLDESIEELKSTDAILNKDDTINNLNVKETKDIFDKIKPFLDTDLIIREKYSPIVSKYKHSLLRKVSNSINSDFDDEFSLFYLKQHFYNFPDKNEVSKARFQKQIFYDCQLDLVLGFNAPEGFSHWLLNIAKSMKMDYVHYPLLFGLKEKITPIDELFIPLISIEIENNVSKHANGGIYNMSKNSYMGIIVTKNEDKKVAKEHVDFCKKELGLNNILNYYVDM